jgi:Protein of unknown function (DUF4231)
MPLKNRQKLSPEKYLEERIEDQIKWYEKKSRSNKRGYVLLRLVEILSAAAIPFLAGFDQHPNTLLAVVALPREGIPA